jgi:hypothetical protein
MNLHLSFGTRLRRISLERALVDGSKRNMLDNVLLYDQLLPKLGRVGVYALDRALMIIIRSAEYIRRAFTGASEKTNSLASYGNARFAHFAFDQLRFILTFSGFASR